MKNILNSFIVFFLLFVCAVNVYANSELVNSYTALNQLKKSLVAQQEYDKAVGFLKEFIGNHRDSYFADMARVEVGNIYLEYIKDYYKALEYFIIVAKRNKKPELTKQVIKRIKECQQKITLLEIDTLEMALEDYYFRRVSYPISLAALVDEGLVKDKGMLKDSWGSNYIYELLPVDFLPGASDQGFLLLSVGVDKQRGTMDDIMITSSYGNKAITKYIEEEDKLPFVLKHVYRHKNYLGAMLVYNKNGSKKMYKVVQGDSVHDYKVISVGSEGIILYSPDSEIIFIPVAG